MGRGAIYDQSERYEAKRWRQWQTSRGICCALLGEAGRAANDIKSNSSALFLPILRLTPSPGAVPFPIELPRSYAPLLMVEGGMLTA